ncbi:hypothetical protein GCM10027293_04900 [Pontibacter aydingkolensis]
MYMKTSNKLLLGLLIVVLLGITATLGTVRFYAVDKSAKLTPVEEAPAPPAAPEASGN